MGSLEAYLYTKFLASCMSAAVGESLAILSASHFRHECERNAARSSKGNTDGMLAGFPPVALPDPAHHRVSSSLNCFFVVLCLVGSDAMPPNPSSCVSQATGRSCAEMDVSSSFAFSFSEADGSRDRVQLDALIPERVTCLLSFSVLGNFR